MRRFDAQYRALEETIASGAIGAPLIFNSVHRNPSMPGHFVSEMALNDTAVHDIDISRFLLGDEPVAVTVKIAAPEQARRLRRSPVHPDRNALGALVTIETSVNIAYGYDIRGEVVGETGVVDAGRAQRDRGEGRGRFRGRVPADWRERFNAAFDAEFREWLAAAAKGGAAGPSAWDGYVATVASTLGVKAVEGGRREPVALRERPALYAG